MQILNSPSPLSAITMLSFLYWNQKLLFNSWLSVDSCCVTEGSPTGGTSSIWSPTTNLKYSVHAYTRVFIDLQLYQIWLNRAKALVFFLSYLIWHSTVVRWVLFGIWSVCLSLYPRCSSMRMHSQWHSDICMCLGMHTCIANIISSVYFHVWICNRDLISPNCAYVAAKLEIVFQLWSDKLLVVSGPFEQGSCSWNYSKTYFFKGEPVCISPWNPLFISSLRVEVLCLVILRLSHLQQMKLLRNDYDLPVIFLAVALFCMHHWLLC